MSSATPDRPKILFLMSDEHRADVTGYEGNPVARTHTLDWLASEGVVFRNAYTPSPICVPARQCLMSGQLPRTCGVEHFGQDLEPFSMTWARWFSRYAYQTVCAGKLHHTGQDQMQGWTRRISPDAHVFPEYIDGMAPGELERYRPAPGTGGRSVDDEIARAGIGLSRYESQDRLTMDATLELIDQYFADPWYDRTTPHPLLLKVSLLLPHYPFLCDEEKFVHYLNRVPVFEHEGKSDPYDGTHRHCIPKRPPSPRDARRATAAYYGMVETTDAHFDRVLKRLQHVGENLDDWIILYTSDHGENLGEHGTWWKNSFYDSAARVPLIIRYPKRFKPRVVEENVNLCDLFATLCELAEIPLPPRERTVGARGLDSRSLVPLMEGKVAADSGWDDETVSQLGGKEIMIKQGSLKYIHFAGRDILFDGKRDPGERINLVDEKRYARVMAQFRRRCADLGFGPNANPHYVNAGYGA